MKFLYFTRSNGDIDNLPYKTVVDFELTTKSKRVLFIGDEATRFSLQEDSGRHPIWDGSKYISNPDKLKGDAKSEAFLVHRKIVSDMIVEANGKKYSFDHFSMFFFMAEFIGTNGGGFEWKAKGEAKKQHTRSEVEAIYTAARNVIRNSFDAYDTDRTNIIENGDLSLSTVKAENQKQEALKGE